MNKEEISLRTQISSGKKNVRQLTERRDGARLRVRDKEMSEMTMDESEQIVLADHKLSVAKSELSLLEQKHNLYLMSKVGGIATTLSISGVAKTKSLLLISIRMIFSRRRAIRKKMHRRIRRRLLRRARNYRWFLDSVIFHHRRLHQQNREAVARAEMLITKPRSRPIRSLESSILTERDIVRNNDNWRSRTRQRVDIRRVRATSRWDAVVNGNSR